MHVMMLADHRLWYRQWNLVRRLSEFF